MPKDILIYSGISTFMAEFIIRQLDENKNEPMVLRLNTPGGDPVASFGVLAKIQELTDKISIKVDGAADSMGAFILAYAKKGKVEALDVSRIVLHRAAFSPSAELELSELDASELNRINAALRVALEAKIDEAKLKEIKGVTIDDIFSMDSRIDVVLTAAEAKEIGLVDKIVSLTPTEVSAHFTKYGKIAASTDYEAPAETPAASTENKPLNNKKMDINELKSSHPALYDQVFKAGVKAENDRVGSWMVFVKADAEAVTAGIKAGEALSLTDQAELNQKAYAATILASTEDDSADDVDTDKPDADADDTSDDADGDKITAEDKNRKEFFEGVRETFKN